jgi:hypothetical protein
MKERQIAQGRLLAAAGVDHVEHGAHEPGLLLCESINSARLLGVAAMRNICMSQYRFGSVVGEVTRPRGTKG